MSDPMFFNGIDAVTGSYLLPPLEPEQLTSIILGEPLDEAQTQELKAWHERLTTQHFAVKEGVDPKNLAEAGWGIIFAHDADPAIIEALKPLIEHRRAQASANKEHYFQQYTRGEGYRPNESKKDWLARHGVGFGPADPEKVPYYLLLVGGPDKIPYKFQTQLDVQYAVGRICFDTVEEYANYAQSVVEAETKKLKLPRKAAFFGVANPDDPATILSAEQLVQPLMTARKTDADLSNAGWDFDLILKEDAKKSKLAQYLGGSKTPALLFTASHGMGFPNGDPRQLLHQGGLLCQDWPGPREWRKPVPEDFYFSADDLDANARLLGSIAFFFACYGAGTPMLDDFAQQAFKDERAVIAPRPFISRLPQRMLSHPKGGALAVIGHVERAWGYSFVWGKAGRQLAVFDSSLKRLMEGSPIGYAFEFFNERYAELSTVLSDELEEIKFGKDAASMALELAGLWTANNDARNYVILGDPAVRLMVAESGEAALTERPSITLTTGGAGVPQSMSAVVPVNTAPVSAPGDTSFGLFDSPKETINNIGSSIQEFANKLGAFLSASIEDAATLKVCTYTSDNLSQVKMVGGELTGANLRALTYLKIDGDTLICVPEQDGEVDMALWSIHVEMVKQAQESRAQLIKTAVTAASSLVGLGGAK